MDLAPTSLDRTKHRVAILVDGDNFPHSKVADVESRAAQWGEVTIRRVFGDMALHKDWGSQTVYTAMHSTTSAGKNRADMALVVACMDLAHRGLASAFVIVSDDRDFGPLVYHLREQGYRVDWIGKPKPPLPKVASPALATAPRTDVEKKLIKLIAQEPDAAQGISLVRLGHMMKGEPVKVQTGGKASWRAYLKGNPLFVLSGEGQATLVRLKA